MTKTTKKVVLVLMTIIVLNIFSLTNSVPQVKKHDALSFEEQTLEYLGFSSEEGVLSTTKKTSTVTLSEEVKLLIFDQAQQFLSPEYGKVQRKQGTTKGICIFPCKAFGCNNTTKQEVIKIDDYFHQRCPPVTVNGGSECPCFYLIPLISQEKGLSHLRDIISILSNMCNSRFVCQDRSNTPAVAYLDRYFATFKDEIVVGYNPTMSGNKKEEVQKKDTTEVPKDVETIQTIVSETINNESAPPPSERQCKTVSSEFDIIRYISAEELRKKALERCKHSDKFIYYSCVFDSARGVHKTKEEYDEVARFINSKVSGEKRCYSSGDPHYCPFYGSRFDVYAKSQKRVLYEKAGFKITTDISFISLWANKGVNSAVYINYHGGSFKVVAPVNRVWTPCVVKGLHVSKYLYSYEHRYEINVESLIKVSVRVNIRGYINVYVTVPASQSINCLGDCCKTNPVDLPEGHKEITYGVGDPLSVQFQSACYRKALYVKQCISKHNKFKDQFSCVRSNANGY